MNSGAGINITKDTTSHMLTIPSCRDPDSGVYRFVSGDLNTEGKVTVGGIIYFFLL